MAMDVMHGRGVRLRWLMVMVVLLAALPIFALHLVRLQSDSNAAVVRAYEAAADLAAGGAAAHERVTEQARQLLEVRGSPGFSSPVPMARASAAIHWPRGRSISATADTFRRRSRVAVTASATS